MRIRSVMVIKNDMLMSLSHYVVLNIFPQSSQASHVHLQFRTRIMHFARGVQGLRSRLCRPAKWEPGASKDVRPRFGETRQRRAGRGSAKI